MDKPAIKKFAIWARNKLKKDAEYCAEQIGITKEKVVPPLPQSTEETLFFDSPTGEPYKLVGKANIKKYRSLVESLKRESANKEYSAVYDSLIERAAYTWFNRMIAVRYMEVNDLLPSHTRVLSATDERKKEPQIVENPSEAILDYTPEEIKQIQDWQYNIGKNGVADMLFRMLFLKQCYALNEVLPKLFDNEDGYLELLLRINFTDADGVVYHLTHDIKEENWRADKTDNAVQIVGWLYQYYNTEPKEQVFANLKKNIKISKENIPAATQLFTPDWIVRYMVENSLGRLWSEGHPDFDKSEWKYYLDEAPQEPQVAQQLAELRKGYAALTPEDIKCIDPCMGSGHILAYLFDVLMQIYRSAGYGDRDAAASIVEHNLYGLDIDDRAAQMAYFVVMMKGCQYDSRFLRRHLDPHVYAIQESNGINRSQLKFFGNGLSESERNEARLQLEGLLDTLTNAKEYGSILNMEHYNWDLLRSCADAAGEDAQMSMDSFGLADTVAQLKQLIDIGEALGQKYDVVVTNPPYAGAKGLNVKLTEYIQANFQEEKGDLFATFIARIAAYLKTDGFAGMITPTAWLYNPIYALMRKKQLDLIEIKNLVELGSDAFEVGFGTVMFTFSKKTNITNYMGTYLDIKNEVSLGEPIESIPTNCYYAAKMKYFSDYEGYKYSYKITEPYRHILQNSHPLSYYGNARAGLQTDDNARFIREWYEVETKKIDFHHEEGKKFGEEKWFPHIKGGTYRKWYGNLSNVVNWQYDGQEIKENSAKRWGSYTKSVRSMNYYFHDGVAWTHTTYSQPFACRYIPRGVISNIEGPEIFDLNNNLYNVMGMLNSKVMDAIYLRMSDSIHYLAGELSKFPTKISDNSNVDEFVQDNISLSKSDWDSFETSWDFAEHPIVKWSRQLRDATSIGATMAYYYHGERPKVSCPVELCYMLWQGECNDRFAKLKANEEELNRIFIDIYGLQDELTPEVEDKDVTVRRADLGRDIRSLISYAVGCIFGRYSLNKPGLAYAGGDWNPDQYHTFLPDADNVIPITDEEYFTDDIVGRFVEFVKVVYGADTLEENLAFIAKALGVKGTSPRAVIRNYFLNGFYADHVKIYQKRPIYWLYDSGKQNGFKALIYMHRYNADTSGLVRADYLYKMEQVYESEIARMEDEIAHGTSREVAQATKRKEKLVKQLKECKDYDDRLGHIALARIPIDLDDGVKANYDKVQTGADGKKQTILAKI